MQEMWVPSLGGEDPLEKEMATHSRILTWEIPRTEEPGGLQSMRPQRVRHDLLTKHHHLKNAHRALETLLGSNLAAASWGWGRARQAGTLTPQEVSWLADPVSEGAPPSMVS